MRCYAVPVANARSVGADRVRRHQRARAASHGRSAGDGAPCDRSCLLRASDCLLADLILAECVYVLESFYEVPRERVAELMRSAVALPTIETVDPTSLLRALEVYELDRPVHRPSRQRCAARALTV